MAAERVDCDVPGCRHTIGVDRYRRLFKCEPGGWICSTHWRIVPSRLKRIKARHERQRRRFGFYPREAAYERVWRAIWVELEPEG